LVDLVRLEVADSPSSFRLIGELDLSNVPQVAARLEKELREGGKLTIDTSDLTFMDSQGLKMLIDLGAEAARQRTAVRVVNCSGQVKQLFRVAVPTGIPGVEIVGADE
jgi:anti-anti-sigma factor